jgi:hypothetical protein
MKTMERINNLFDGNLGVKSTARSTETADGKTIRSYICQLLDRTTDYRLADYARKASKLFGKEVSIAYIKRSLKSLSKKGKITYIMVGSKVTGFTHV